MFYSHENRKRLFEKNWIKHQFLAFGEGPAHGLAFLSFFEEAKFLLDFLDFLVGDLAIFDGPASEVFFRVGFLFRGLLTTLCFSGLALSLSSERLDGSTL
jgi:hypothetical protein